MDKDPHLKCPNHIGWQCCMDRRCEVCGQWSTERMRQYCNLQESKKRKRAYRERKKIAEAKQGSASSHYVSDSSFDDNEGKVVEVVRTSENPPPPRLLSS